MTSKRNKFFLFFLSTIISLSILEFSLRFSGQFFSSYTTLSTEKDYHYEEHGNDSPVILTIGDSFTNGGAVAQEETYPSHLQKILHESGVNPTVYNWGRCEDSTRSTKNRLFEFLEKVKKGIIKKPQHIFMLVGSADLFGHHFEAHVDNDITRIVSIDNNSWWRRLRIYKVYRYIRFQIQNSGSIDEVIKKAIIDPRKKELVFEFYNVFKRGLDKRTRKFIYSKSHRELTYSVFKLNEEEENFVSELVLSLNKNGLLDVKAYFKMLNYISYRSENSMRLTKMYMKLIEDMGPLFFTQDKDDFKFFTYSFLRAFKFQSAFTPSVIIKFLNMIKDENKEIAVLKEYRRYGKLFSSWSESFNGLDKKRLNHWIDIVDKVKKYNINLVALTYPSNFKQTNSLIRAVSRAQNIDLIDLKEIFYKQDDVEEYLLDDDHANAKGHMLIAKSVADYISKKQSN